MSFSTLTNKIFQTSKTNQITHTSSSKTYLLTYTQTLRVKIEIHLDLVMSVHSHHSIKIFFFLNTFIDIHNNHLKPMHKRSLINPLLSGPPKDELL